MNRIICLTEETVETLYLLGREDLIVGVSQYVERPPEAKNLPVVSQFIRSDIEKIVALKPDLVIGFSDLQKDIASEAFFKRDIK
jgi:iron complex transport system substrate-binding protein